MAKNGPKNASAETLSASRLVELLHYSPGTGEFVWAVKRNKLPAGSVAGKIDQFGYRLIRVDGRIYRAHRLAFLWMTGSFPPDAVDHIDGDRSNNAWANLRPATPGENNQHKRVYRNNSTGAPGVVRSRNGRAWIAQIAHGGKVKHLGTFATFEEAKAARAEAKAKLHPFAVSA